MSGDEADKEGEGGSEGRLLDLDPEAHHPEFQLLETISPALFELPHPLTILCRVGHIDEYPHQVVPVDDPTVPPVTFHLLRLVTGGTEVIHDLEDGVGEPLRRYLSAVVKAKGKQDLESPPSAAHRWPCL